MVRKAVVGAALLLAGCSESNPNICASFDGEAEDATRGMSGDVKQYLVARSCVTKWAGRLSYSKESAPTVADAAIGACSEAIRYQFLDQNPEEQLRSTVASKRSLRERAIFIATMNRAGNCRVGVE